MREGVREREREVQPAEEEESSTERFAPRRKVKLGFEDVSTMHPSSSTTSAFGSWGLGFKVPGLGFRVPGSGFGVPGFWIRVLGSGFRVPGFWFWFLVFGFRVFGFRVSGFGFRASSSSFRLSVSGFGFWVQSLPDFESGRNLVTRSWFSAQCLRFRV